MKTFRNREGRTLQPGTWYNFGGNISLMLFAKRKNSKRWSYAMRCDTTGEITHTKGPASEDAVSMGLYRSATPVGYASFCFGRDFHEEE
jgi:hypothetical protein